MVLRSGPSLDEQTALPVEDQYGQSSVETSVPSVSRQLSQDPYRPILRVHEHDIFSIGGDDPATGSIFPRAGL